jgi:hypothetical protein
MTPRCWSAASLTKGFARSIVGFDVRDKPSIQRDRAKIQYLGSWYDRPSMRLTIDPVVWPTRVDYTPDIDHNGLDLLDDPALDFRRYGLCDETTIVGFDVPDEWARQLVELSGVRIAPLESVLENKDFRFCGFDVADIRGRTSAFYSFDWETREMEGRLKKLSVKLNEWGLLDGDAEAIRASNAFDDEIPEHSPFCPCGVWVAT